MPIYEYKCAEHGVFEVILPIMSPTEDKPCPQCKKPCGKIISLTTAIYKGDGFTKKVKNDDHPS